MADVPPRPPNACRYCADERNVELAQDRLGMFPIDVTDHRTSAQ